MEIVTHIPTQLLKAATDKKPKKLADKLSTKAWYSTVATINGGTSAHEVARFFERDLQRMNPNKNYSDTIESRIWNKYRAGMHKPSLAMRTNVERVYPGTEQVLLIGPYNTPLWEALCGEDVAKTVSELFEFDTLLQAKHDLENDLEYCEEFFLNAAMFAWPGIDTAQHQTRTLLPLCVALLCYRWHSAINSTGGSAWYRVLRAGLSTNSIDTSLTDLGILDDIVAAVKAWEAKSILKSYTASLKLRKLSHRAGHTDPLYEWVEDPAVYTDRIKSAKEVFVL
jgi:hypothetical protein